MTSSAVEISNPTKIPDAPHFAVLVKDSVFVDDGYGGPGRSSGSSREIMRYLQFNTLPEVEAWILAQEKTGQYTQKVFRVLMITPCSVERTVTVAVAQPVQPLYRP